MSLLDKLPLERTNLFVVFDYETSGLHRDDGAHPSTLGVKWGPSRDEQLAIPVDQGVLDKPGSRPTLFGDAPNVDVSEWRLVHRWLEKQRLIAHNAKADLWFAYCGLRTNPGVRWDLSKRLTWDTMIVESLLRPGERVSLDLVAKRNGWNGPYEAADRAMRNWAKKNKLGGAVRYDLAPWDLLEPYLLGDLERTWKLYKRQLEQYHQGELPAPLVEREISLVTCLFRMEQQGLPFNVEKARKAEKAARAEQDRIAESLPFDPHSKSQLVSWLRGFGVPLVKTDKGELSVDQAALQRALDRGVPHAEQYRLWKSLQTAASLWYGGWADKTGADGRIRADYRQVKSWEGNRSSGTVSGRFAVSRVNVQAIPSPRQVPEGYPTMQELIASGTRTQLWEADLSQAEMRVVAVLSKCESMLEGFRQGFDAHDSTTKLIWGIEPGHPDWKARRQVAKRLGFGVVYGAGIKTLAAQILQFTGEDLGEQGVRDLWDQYRKAFPELFRYNSELQRKVEKDRFLVLPGGKLRVFGPDEYSYKALNALIQGAVAVGMTEAMLAIDSFAPGVLVGQVHDSVLFETDDPEVVSGVKARVSSTFEFWFPGCPFPVEAERVDLKL